jgi:hypothetical protein
VVPPSIGMTAPVMYADRSEARNDASSATSSGWPPASTPSRPQGREQRQTAHDRRRGQSAVSGN